MLHPEIYDGPDKFEERKKYVSNKYPYLSWQSKVENMSEKQIETLFNKFQEEEIISITKEVVNYYGKEEF